MNEQPRWTLGDLEAAIEASWEARGQISPTTIGFQRETVEAALDLLDCGRLRVAEKIDGEWVTHQWLKKAVLLSFRLHANEVMGGAHGMTHGPGMGPWWDKIPSKFGDWTAGEFANAGFRAVPGAVVRRGAFVGKNAILMPSFVNIGAYVDEGTMVDTWSTVGSGAQIGKDCHLSGGVGIGGVLEPLQANPTIIEDNCFIGARSEVAEGVIVGEGAVLSMGVFLTASTKIIDRKTGEVHRGRVPPYSVVVPGALPDPHGLGPSLACAVIVKTVDAQTRSKTSPNELLRD
ncbi:MAG TPA: 2,3,4,5-tetrahydropyridine-2,6-dicarboxylate N-succinyltransferase [Caulobacteraceae bacterium]|jgi:2,3,4,5-tetrahydropyridine-2-carboxylate N-succinyltransferase|nr:2,3,4,5-tetrahydropyridine-2,6-dicarboxylate N-succinyltransferase [Caulobacteraceae bacterium]